VIEYLKPQMSPMTQIQFFPAAKSALSVVNHF